MTESANEASIQKLFISGVHHKSTSLIFLTNNLFNDGKFARDMRKNTNGYVVMKSPSMADQVFSLGKQLYRRKATFLEHAYHEATKKPYSHLVIDNHPKCHDHLRVRSGILPGENQIVYLPRQ